MSQLHSLLTANHRPYAGVYADSTERLAATGFVRALGGGTVPFATEDLYKKVLQLNDASEWILTAITPTWVQVSGAGSLANDSITNAKMANMANATVKGRTTAGTGDPEDLTMAQLYALVKGQIPVAVSVAASDESTALTTGTAKLTFHMPYAMTLTEVIGELVTPQTSGSIFTIDVNEAGTTILSTKVTIDNGEETSLGGATPPVISDPNLAKGAKITVDIDQIGDGTAKGLKVHLVGTLA